MFTIRKLRWPEDRPLLLGIDGSFTTDRIYRLDVDGHIAALREETVDPPLAKKFPLPGDVESLPASGAVRVAVDSSSIVGFAAAKYEQWNRRAVLQHIYVSSGVRGMGIGRLLTSAIFAEAKAWGARCIWAEAQTTNYKGIQFYERMGFTLCGFDASLYDPAVAPNEVALFFAREL